MYIYMYILLIWFDIWYMYVTMYSKWPSCCEVFRTAHGDQRTGEWREAWDQKYGTWTGQVPTVPTTTATTTTTTTTLHYANYTTPHRTTLHYTNYNYNYTITLHSTTRHYTRLHDTALHFFTTLHSITLQVQVQLQLHYITLRYTTLILSHYATLNYTTVHYTTVHYTTLHYITLHSITLHHNYS